MKSTNECIDYVINTGKNIPHGNSSFANHLLGVYGLLVLAKAPEYLCLAGLFHAIYGTEYFSSGIEVSRELVSDYIGKEAEELVFLFCHLRDRDNTILKSANKDLIFLNLMNLQENYNSNSNNTELFEMLELYKQVYSINRIN